MDEENKAFCTQCGAILPEGAQFCPKCSAPCNMDSPNNEGTHFDAVAESRLNSTQTFVFVYVLIAALLGALVLISTLSITSDMWDEIVQSMASQGTDVPWTFDTFKAYMYAVCLCEFVSAAFAFISYYYIKNRSNYTFALIACLIATVTSINGIITFIIGLYMVYRIYTSKQCFKE